MSSSRRNFLRSAALGSGLLVGSGAGGRAPAPAGGSTRLLAFEPPGYNSPPIPEPAVEKPASISMAQWVTRKIHGVSAAEVHDYAPAGFKGRLSPSPPHADLNPNHTVIVSWEGLSHRFVFWHEASYDPWTELPNGVALCTQFFEGNNGWAELFNNSGRRERNSFVSIIQGGPERVWVRWEYFCVNKDDDSHPALHGTEDYITHANGLIWRRLTYSTMMPDKPEGYSWQPIDFFALAPSGTTWADLFPRDDQHGDYHVASALDAYSERRYDVFWAENQPPRRKGDRQTLLDISHSKGFALIMPFTAGHLFTILGAASGFPSEKSQIVDHSFTDTGGWGWGPRRWDHWPIGWVNAQAHDYKPGSPYPYHFSPFSHYIVNKPLGDAHRDYPIEARDMDLNRWTERRVFYTLAGVGQTLESIRQLAKHWLDQGQSCASPQSAAGLAWPAL